jgi:hypothetical protein
MRGGSRRFHNHAPELKSVDKVKEFAAAGAMTGPCACLPERFV